MRTFAVSDLHGMIDLYWQIKNFLKPEDKVYYLGDMGDRGTNCWETVKVIMDDPQFRVIKGNHEDMLIKAMKAWYKLSPERKDMINSTKEVALLHHNGGTPTFEGWLMESKEEKSKWFHRLQTLPTHLEYTNKFNRKIYMSHAGFTPCDYDDFPVDEDLIWDRSHYLYGWYHKAPDDIIVIHGHTPIPYMVDDLHLFSKEPYDFPELPMAYWYADNHKCCIDNGAFYYQCTVLLDLDTFQEHKFYTKDYDPEAKWD